MVYVFHVKYDFPKKNSIIQMYEDDTFLKDLPNLK